MNEQMLFVGLLLAMLGLSGPAALIISIINSKRIGAIEEGIAQALRRGLVPKSPAPEMPKIEMRPLEVPPPITPPKPAMHEYVEKPIVIDTAKISQVWPHEQKPSTPLHEKPDQKMSLEVMLGTKWMAIAGAIAMTIGAIVALKYMYDNAMIGALGRTIIVACWGVVGIIVGHLTRVRGYDIAAKSVTALGFGLLYAADFAAFGLYKLIGAEPAFGLAILITAGALLYAALLNEMVMAFLAMLGGYLSPVLLSTGQNKPNALFGYVTILSAGVMAAAIWRKWRSVNALAFAGTAILYIAWFWKYYSPDQLPEATTWLAIFFVIFLTLPLIYELSKRKHAKREDVWLILTNAMFTFAYLGAILFNDHRNWMAFSAAMMSVAHFAMMAVVHKRTTDDKTLKALLFLIALALLTAAMALYLKMHYLTIAYFTEAVVLTAMAIRYNSITARVSAIVVSAIAAIAMIKNLPLHHGQFTAVFNPDFGTWIFGAAAFYFCQFLHRKHKDALSQWLAHTYFCAAMLILVFASEMEWYYYTSHMPEPLYLKGVLLGLMLFGVITLLPKFSPPGNMPVALSGLLTAASVLFSLGWIIDLGRGSQYVYLNQGFAFAILPVISLAVFGYLTGKRDSLDDDSRRKIKSGSYLAIIFFVWLLLTKEMYQYWQYWQYTPRGFEIADRYGLDKGQMWISMIWAVYSAAILALGLRLKLVSLRYVAMGFITLTVLKVFLFDTRKLEGLYQIATFIMLGAVLIALSYLYHHLRKRGFF